MGREGKIKDFPYIAPFFPYSCYISILLTLMIAPSRDRRTLYRRGCDCSLCMSVCLLLLDHWIEDIPQDQACSVGYYHPRHSIDRSEGEDEDKEREAQFSVASLEEGWSQGPPLHCLKHPILQHTSLQLFIVLCHSILYSSNISWVLENGECIIGELTRVNVCLDNSLPRLHLFSFLSISHQLSTLNIKHPHRSLIDPTVHRPSFLFVFFPISCLRAEAE